jgi:hypothetical protein
MSEVQYVLLVFGGIGKYGVDFKASLIVLFSIIIIV